MRKIIFFLLGILCMNACALGAEDSLYRMHKSLKDEHFVVETDQESRSESLNRISGHYDIGFSLPEQSYESSDHYRPGAFGRQESQDKASQSY